MTHNCAEMGCNACGGDLLQADSVSADNAIRSSNFLSLANIRTNLLSPN
jgi:hypothetical protein